MRHFEDFAAEPAICRFCNHLEGVHSSGGCTVEGCSCEGFGLPFVRRDVVRMARQAKEQGLDLQRVAEILDVPRAELEKLAEEV